MVLSKFKASWLLLILLAFQIIFMSSNVSSVNELHLDNESVKDIIRNDYYIYLDEHKDAGFPIMEIELSSTNLINYDNTNIEIYDIFENREEIIVVDGDDGYIEWEVTIPETGLYNMAINYFPINSTGRDIELMLTINGELPYGDARRLMFPRIWKDETDIRFDTRDNHLRPRQVEAPRWVTAEFKDTEGLYNDPYYFFFEAGVNIVKIEAVNGNFAIEKLEMYNRPDALTYENYKESISAHLKLKSQEGFIEIFQAEHAYEKSNSMLYPTFDRSTPATQPSHPSKMRLNTIGQQNWGYAGQWIKWQVDVPEDGIYNIGLRARNNIIRGMNVTRRIYINDKILFDDMENVSFPYDINWYMKVLGDDDPYEFYLEKGINTIKMEVVLGDMADTLLTIEGSVFRLNELYRNIIMITGASPDRLRDYYLDEEIPDLIHSFSKIRNVLEFESHRIQTITGRTGTEASIIDQMVKILDELILDPDTIPERLVAYRDYVSGLASLLLRIKEQPLELDYFVVASPRETMPKAKAGFFEKMIFDIKAFFYSFIEDYDTLGTPEDGRDALDVWITTGRDQGQVIRSMLDDLFTPQSGIGVNLKIVDVGGTIIQASLAGQGPDIALSVSKDFPINLAMRGALVDLSTFPEYKDIESNFFDSAIIPFRYQGGVYAIPEAQGFEMIFYRTDIFEELGIKVPDTWEEFYHILAIIQNHNMQAGILESAAVAGLSTGISAFDRFLYQNGGQYYTDDLRATAFNQPAALRAFEEWVDLYTKYGLDRTFDFYNRFRTGEMPMAIQPYTMYNMLSYAAPEIRGLWEMEPVPGRRRSDGTIDRAQTSNVSGSIMLKGTKNEDDSFEFIEWWTSADVQARYGNDLESIMGPAARYNPANIDAFYKIPWNNKETETIMKQWEHVTDVPQIPGNYYIYRSLSNAFREVVDFRRFPRGIFNKFNEDMNRELIRKRIEFGLD